MNILKNMTLDMLDGLDDVTIRYEKISDDLIVLRKFALQSENEIFAAIQQVTSQSDFRHLITPGGFRMSVAMTNCGSYGWVSDRKGYRYQAHDPLSGVAWPSMPEYFLKLATDAASEAGFKKFIPDACLLNRYEPGTRLTLHQDKNEKDFNAPIVSVSLGLPAVFLFGGLNRTDKTRRIPLGHGDVVVWGGAERLSYHGIMPLKEGNHHLFGRYRFNLTFRKAM
jgi:alkylated DNA repair protein (DNA oxidative demethylase)